MNNEELDALTIALALERERTAYLLSRFEVLGDMMMDEEPEDPIDPGSPAYIMDVTRRLRKLLNENAYLRQQLGLIEDDENKDE